MRAVTLVLASALFLAVAVAAVEGPDEARGAPRPPCLTGRRGGDYPAIALNGAWNWCNGPHAVFHQGASKRTYVGWITNTGAVQVASYDHDTGVTEVATVRDGFEHDDHSAPAIVVRPDGRLMAFYSPHCRTVPQRTPSGESIAGLFYRVSERPEDVSAWGDEVRLDMNVGGQYGWTYPTPAQLADEANRIYLFWRGASGEPLLALSDDGVSWVFGGPFLRTGGDRPYFKLASDGRGRIDVAFTRGHPDIEPENGIYYVRYEGGAIYRTDGTKLKDVWDIPLEAGECDTVYDGRGRGRAWLWDVAADSLGNPAIAYAVFPSDDDHRYRYARWDGSRWLDNEIVEAGSWFPSADRDALGSQLYYSGGIAIDQGDPDVVYLSRPVGGEFEIERWVTRDAGRTWSSEPVTCGSEVLNVRPVVPEGHAPGGPDVVWMHGEYRDYVDYATDLRMRVMKAENRAQVEAEGAGDAGSRAEDIAAFARRVCDRELASVALDARAWELARASRGVAPDLPGPQWSESVFFIGVLAAHELTGDAQYLAEARGWADRHAWQLAAPARHANSQCAAQVYLQMWRELPLHERRPEMIHPAQAAFDAMLADPQPGREEWDWCDALFMAPPALALLSEATGNPAYLDLMDRMWWDATDHLYDAREHLYYRDEGFKKPAPPGEGAFWGRGNGWVMAGIARVLDVMPGDYPMRPRYENLLREMADRVAGLQAADGLWRSDLTHPDPGTPPETSASALFCYAVAWGVNHGVLDRERFLPVVRAAWDGLAGAVDETGRLGWVQPVSDRPGPVRRESTARFGVGPFIMAAGEMVKLEAAPGSGGRR